MFPRPFLGTAILAATVGSAAAEPIVPHDLSPLGMFLAADVVVKSVMLGLVAASVATWTIWLVKSFELAAARHTLARFARKFAAVPTLEAAVDGGLARGGAPGARMVGAAIAELDASEDAPAGVEERIRSRLARIEAETGRRMARGTGLLATIGSTAPFVGLFGTVWGIMNAFVGISRAQTTNLAVVAPGIAEALLATAIGLAAAIPAVVIYNVFARAVTGYRAGVADVAAEIQRTVSRDLARGTGG